MKKFVFPGMLVVLPLIFTSCIKEGIDREKTVEMYIYPEFGYGGYILSDVFTEILYFSDSDNKEKRPLTNMVTEGFDFEYEPGYEYSFKAKKVWMADPPQDVSSIKYVFVGPLKKKQIITEDKQSNLQVKITPRLVQFAPHFSRTESDPNVFDTFMGRETVSNELIVFRDIEGFNFEEGYSYLLDVRKEVTADPYAVKYVLNKVLEKSE